MIAVIISKAKEGFNILGTFWSGPIFNGLNFIICDEQSISGASLTEEDNLAAKQEALFWSEIYLVLTLNFEGDHRNLNLRRLHHPDMPQLVSTLVLLELTGSHVEKWQGHCTNQIPFGCARRNHTALLWQFSFCLLRLTLFYNSPKPCLKY